MIRLKIISGGQTGADQGALKAAKASGVPTGGFIPWGFLTESGYTPELAKYGLEQMDPAQDYRDRTLANVAISDGVLWFGNPHSPGGKLTLSTAAAVCFVPQFIVLFNATPKEAADWVFGMLYEGNERDEIKLLVSGNRESRKPGIGVDVEVFMTKMIAILKERTANESG